MSELGGLTELGAVYTVLARAAPKPDGVPYRTVEDLAARWSAGDGSDEDLGRYRRFLPVALEDPEWRPELLFQPSNETPCGWILIDGVHRAATLYTAWTTKGRDRVPLSVFVLPRPLL